MGKFLIFTLVIAIIAILPAWLTIQAGDDLRYMLPNLMLFFPDVASREYLKSLWAQPEYTKVDTRVVYEHTRIPQIKAEDYSWDALRVATQNFRRPALVKGLFKDTAAVEKWGQAGYLGEKIGRHEIEVVRGAVYGTTQRNRSSVPFADAVADVIGDENNQDYLFFPLLSRQWNESYNQDLFDAVTKTVMDDLELDKRIWNGFGTKIHSTFFGSQMIIGRGREIDSDETTGTGWHCAIANNYFIQTTGTKRWYFMDPPYSTYMKTLRGGIVHMITGNQNVGAMHKHIPLRYADVEAGDMLFNPPWEWHAIKNYPGLSIGVPIREANMTLSFVNNFHFSSVVAWSRLLVRLGFKINTY